MDNLSILIKTLLQPISDADIVKFKEKLQTQLGNVNVNGGKGIKLLDQNEIEIYVQKMNNAVSRLKIGKDKVFSNIGVQDELNKFQGMLSAFGTTGGKSTKEIGLQFDNLKTKVSQVSNEFKNVNKDGYSFVQMIELAGKKIAIWGLSTSLVYGSLRQLKEGISYITDLDNSLNEIRIVTGQSQEEVENLAKSYNNLAKQMSVTTKEISSEAANLFRQGLDSGQVEERMKAIIQYAKISSISLKESDQIITSTANATGENVQKIIDIFALLGDKTASGANEIGEALQRVASASENSGLSLEKTASWISTISSITRESASTIGRSISSVISRYESIKSQGFNEEDATKLNDVTKALSSIGITATDALGQLRPFADVMDELGTKFDNLSKNEQAYITTALFGTYQRNRGLTLLKNYNDSLKNYETALNSAGTAEQKYNIYQESTQAKLDKLKASWEGFWQSNINSDIIKEAISGLTNVLGFLNSGFIKFIGTVAMATIGAKLLSTGLNGLSGTTILTRLGVIALDIAEKGLLATSRALFTTLSTSPLFWVATATTVVYGLVKAFDSFTVTVSEQKEKVEEVKQAYTETSNEIQKLNAELEQTKNSINELNSKDKLSITEKNELNKLQLSNKELETRIALLQKEKDIKEKRLGQEQETLYNKQFGKYDFSQSKVNEYQSAAKLTGNNAMLTTESNNIAALSAAYKQFSDLKQKALDSGDLNNVEHFEGLLTNIQESLIKTSKELITIKEGLLAIKNPTEEQKKIIDNIDQGLNLINKIVIPDKLSNINEGAKKAIPTLEEINAQIKSMSKNMDTSVDGLTSDLKNLNQAIADVRQGNSLSAETVLDLIEKYNLSANAIKKTTDGYTIELSALENVRKSKIQTALDAIESEKKHALAVKDQVEARLKNYGLEITELKNLAAAKAKLAQQANEEAAKQANAATLGASDAGIRNGIYSKVYNEYMSKAGADVVLAQKTLKSIEEIESKSKILTTILNDKDYGVKDQNSKSRNSSSMQQSEALLEKDRYYQLNQELNKTNALLQKNAALQENASYSEKIKLLDEETRLLKIKQTQIHAIAEEERKEREELVKSLKSQGVKFSGVGDNISASNAQNALDSKLAQVNAHRNDKDKSTYNNLKSQYDSLKKSLDRFFEIQLTDLPKSTEEWQKYQKEINGIVSDKLELKTNNLKLSYEAGKITLSNYIQELEKLRKTSGLTQTQIDQLTKTIRDLTKQQNELAAKALETAQKEAEDKIKTYEDAEKAIIDLLKKRYEKQNDLLEQEKKNFDKHIDDAIKALDRLKEAEDYNTDVNDMSKKILEKQQEIDKRKAAVAQGDWVAINETMELEKDKAELVKDLQNKQKDRSHQVQKDALQDMKDNNDEAIQHQIDNNNALIEDTALKLQAQKILTTGTIAEIQNTIANLFTQTGENAAATGKIIQDQLIAKIAQIQTIYAEMQKLQFQATGNVTNTEQAKAKIGQLQTQWNATDDIAEKTSYHQQAENLRKQWNLPNTNYTNYMPSYDVGTLNHPGGLAKVHKDEIMQLPKGTQVLPKSFSELSMNVTSSLLNSIIPNINTPNFTPISAMGGGFGDINLGGIVINSPSVDSRSIPNLAKQVTQQVLGEMKSVLNSRGQYRR